MTYLIFDTETSGFPDKQLSEHDKDQARCVQLALLLLDNEFNEIGSFYSILSLDSDKTINPGAENVHGISKEMCFNYGVSPDIAIDVFTEFYQLADVVVAHNIRFDKSVMDIETAVRGYKHVWNKREICTMDATTELCKLPSKIPGKYKWPKLSEALSIVCGESLFDAHDAGADVKGCAKLLKYLQQSKVGIVSASPQLATTQS